MHEGGGRGHLSGEEENVAQVGLIKLIAWQPRDGQVFVTVTVMPGNHQKIIQQCSYIGRKEGRRFYSLQISE